jgi:MerR family transcriptional regulator/heat shock protein HspR
MNVPNDEPLYVISIAARMLGVQTHTLRYYERLGLLEPSRTKGKIRLYSQRDIERVQTIKRLMEDLGVNLAGVEVIMNMNQRMLEMQRENEYLREQLALLTGRRALPDRGAPRSLPDRSGAARTR